MGEINYAVYATDAISEKKYVLRYFRSRGSAEKYINDRLNRTFKILKRFEIKKETPIIRNPQYLELYKNRRNEK